MKHVQLEDRIHAERKRVNARIKKSNYFREINTNGVKFAAKSKAPLSEREKQEIDELVSWIQSIPQRPVSDFQGKYHHLKFDWRASAASRDSKVPDIDELWEVLSTVDKEERKAFMGQVVWAIIKGYEKELFDAAFGTGV